jgi:phosphoribosylformimino-5-aminoimidazole carboxamide ribotide isomerase
VQAGGGVRSREDVERLLDAGVSRVVVGSAAVRRPDEVGGWLQAFGPERITVAMDVRVEGAEPEVAAHGWTEGSGVTLWSALDALAPAGLAHVLVTDIARDGALAGPNLPLMQEIVRRRPELQLQASGGVRALEDLAELSAAGAAGAIVGKALYEGLFTVEEALRAG